MCNKKKNFSKKPLTFSLFSIFLFTLIAGTGFTSNKSNDINSPFTEKTISSILSTLSGDNLIIVLKNPNNDQGDDTENDGKKEDKKKTESDPYDNNGSRTSKKKANSED
ncbi:MAG: hypothetical protein JW755_10290 [Candidatus Aminicenantes bacterium]|nr:hypothetical protein [Candidatus Aminicenantes bacterium]